jgi:hypothetical protein
VGNKVIIAWTLSHLGGVLRGQGQAALATTLAGEGVSVARETGIIWVLPYGLRVLGRQAQDTGDSVQASSLYGESLNLYRRTGGRRGIIEGLEAVAGLAVSQGDLPRAVRLYAVAQAGREAIGAPRPPRSREAYERDLATIRTGLGEEAFATAWKEGQAMTLEQACDLAHLR